MKPGHFLLPVLAIVLVMGSCKKSNTGTHPKMSLGSINTQIKPNDSMIAVFNFDNSGGTLGTGTFYSIRIRLNQSPPFIQAGPDTLSTSIPDFGGANKGQFRYVLNWDDYLSGSGHVNDTLQFKFFALTPDSVSTDTITSPQIVVINP
ncbi:MAG TPA: hypothetical protein VNU70_04485 [Puia sp.]|jgi:hypothetical protein|nr:hypothetical protein [Puia sp.]